MAIRVRIYYYECPKCGSHISAFGTGAYCKCGAPMIREDEWKRKQYYRNKRKRDAEKAKQARE